MKILHLSKYSIFAPGGIERFVKDLVEYQKESGLDVKVICFDNKNSVKYYKDIEIITVKIDFHLSYAPFSLKYLSIFNQILKNFNPDIIHIHMPNSMPLFLNYNNFNGKIVVHWHSDVFFTKSDIILSCLYNIYRIFENKLLKKAHAIISTSEEYFTHSKTLKNFFQKVSIIPLGIKQIKANNIEYGDFFLSVGRFSYYKGFKYLVKAMELLDDSYKLIIAGEGEEFEKIKKMIKEKNLIHRIILTGKISEKEKISLLKKCKFFCLPSIERTEAFGISLLEAMQFKKPLLTTDIKGSGVNFVNIHNQTGIVVPPQNPEKLANAIKKLYKSSDLCIQYGENSLKRFIKFFTIENCGKKIKELYLKLNNAN